ncbi:MAG: methionyl-tRNA formyltransferase [Nitrospirae bacterium]|nr:MAG: methionyl-tRNA formyltransferase [Nitrospirota bacterium]
MSVIFFGTPDFAVPSLQALLDSGEDVRLVVTQPDKLKGRGHKLSVPPVKQLALANGTEVVQPESIRTDEFAGKLSLIAPEFIIVVAYGKILPRRILDIPQRGCVNVHASLLPKYRGAAPIQWALINGESVTGVTTMLMDEGLDSGDVLLQREEEIREYDNAATLFERLSKLGGQLIVETVNRMRKGTANPVLQNGEPTYAPPLKKEDGRIDWNKSAKGLECLIRGVTPWPSAFCYFDKERIKILKASQQPTAGSRQSSVPGRLQQRPSGELAVETGEGLLLIEELQPEGKKAMSGKAFAAGRRITGEKFFS